MPKRLSWLAAAAALLTGLVFFALPARAATEVDYIVTGAGAGGGPHVKLWHPDGSFADKQWMAYDPGFTGGVDVAMGDLNGDGSDEVITAPGQGGGPHVRVFDVDGHDLGWGFMAYDPGFTGGVNLGVADVDHDGSDEIITGAGPGGGPHVRTFELNDAGTAIVALGGFMAGPTTSRAGVDVTGVWTDPTSEDQFIATSDGANGAGFVRIFNPAGQEQGAFQPYPGFSGGARIAAADTDANGDDELITGAGPGGGPHVRAFDSGPTSAGRPVAEISFMAYGSGFRGGVDVGSFFESSDVEAQSIVTGAGRGGGPHVRGFDPPAGSAAASFFAYPSAFTGGVHVDGGFLVVP